MTTQHQTGIQGAFTPKEAAAAAGLTVDSWRSWQKRGLVPAGTLIPTSGGKPQRRIFTHAEVEAARAAVDRMGRPTAEHTISREEGARMLGISIGRWDVLRRKGLIPAGRWTAHPQGFGRGGRCMVYSPAEIESARQAIAAVRSPRPTIDGEESLTRQQAAAMIGIPQRQWYLWEAKGWMPEGTWVPRIGAGGTMKVFTPAEITELKAAIARGEHPSCEEAPTHEHTITREEAARAVGLSTGRWDQLGRRGLVPRGRLVRNPGGGRRRMYSRADVASAQEAIEGLRKDRRPKVNGQEAITLKEAAELIGISCPLWYCWESKGWTPEGHRVPKLAGGGMMKVYLPAEIDALRTAIARGEHPGVKDRGTPEHTITRRKAAAMLGITVSMWNQWEKDGIVPPGKRPPLSPSLGLHAGRHLWTPAQVEDVRRRAQELGVMNPAATPEHTLTRDEAAELAGISIQMWTHWSRRGVIPPGRWSPHGKGSGKGGLRRLHSPEEVRQARAALDEIGFGRAPNATDEHTIPQRKAARMLGVEPSALQKWEKRGLMPIGAWGRSKKGPGLCKLYTAAQVEAARDALVREGVRCFARATPEHTITRQQAARIIGVPWSTWSHWEGQGRTPIGAWAPSAGGRGRCKLYSRQELEAFAEELRTQHQPYPDPERPGCYRVPIRSWKRRMEAIIDAEDLPLVEGKNWNYSERSDGYEYETRGVVTLSSTSTRKASLKQIITGRRGPRWRIRHANGDFLDCRRANLIVLDIAEQSYGNRKMRTRAGKQLTSKYKGVCWCESRGKWLAQIRKDDAHRHLGRFDDEIDAAEAYDKAAQELFGEFARLNFPSSGEGATRSLAAA